jgi:hypothetical protein
MVIKIKVSNYSVVLHIECSGGSDLGEASNELLVTWHETHSGREERERDVKLRQITVFQNAAVVGYRAYT